MFLVDRFVLTVDLKSTSFTWPQLEDWKYQHNTNTSSYRNDPPLCDFVNP